MGYFDDYFSQFATDLAAKRAADQMKDAGVDWGYGPDQGFGRQPALMAPPADGPFMQDPLQPRGTTPLGQPTGPSVVPVPNLGNPVRPNPLAPDFNLTRRPALAFGPEDDTMPPGAQPTEGRLPTQVMPPVRQSQVPTSPALSADSVAGGSGIIYPGAGAGSVVDNSPVAKADEKIKSVLGQDYRDRLQRGALWMQSLDNPQALNQLSQFGPKPGRYKQEVDYERGVIRILDQQTGEIRETPIPGWKGPKEKYDFKQGVDGTWYRVGQNTGSFEPVGSGKKPEEYSVTHGPNGEVIRYGKYGSAPETVTAGKDKYADAFDTKRAADDVTYISHVQTAADKARAGLSDIQQARNLVNTGTIWLGTGGEHVKSLQRFGATLFGEVPVAGKWLKEGASNADALSALSNQFTLKIRNIQDGMGMPGAMSDKDLAFLKEASFGFGKTKEGNLKALDYMARYQQRIIDTAEFTQRYMDERNGRLDNGYRSALREWVNANPLFPPGVNQATPTGSRPPLSSFNR